MFKQILPNLTSQKRINSIKPIMNLFVKQSLQQISPMFCNNAGNMNELLIPFAGH